MNVGRWQGRGTWLKKATDALVFVLLGVAVLRLATLYLSHSPARVNLHTLHFTQLDGNSVPSQSLAGKALLINFWAPWCPPCRIETPWLQHLQTLEAGKLVVVGVVADADEYQHAEKLMRRKGISYLLVRDSPAVKAAFGQVSVLPTSFYVSPSGTVVHTTRGLIPEPLMILFAHESMHG